MKLLAKPNVFFIFILFQLTSCLPAAFTAVTASTLAVSKDRSLGNTIDDVRISSKIKTSFLSQGFRNLYVKINVEVVQSRVMLTGKVANSDEVSKAIEIAWSVYGVKEVINELKVDENSDHFNTVQYAKDAWISSRIKAALFFKRDIKFVNYTIVTNNNIVYLFGIARSEEELDKVVNLASKIAGVEKVKSYVHLRVLGSDNKDDNTISSNNNISNIGYDDGDANSFSK